MCSAACFSNKSAGMRIITKKSRHHIFRIIQPFIQFAVSPSIEKTPSVMTTFKRLSLWSCNFSSRWAISEMFECIVHSTGKALCRPMIDAWTKRVRRSWTSCFCQEWPQTHPHWRPWQDGKRIVASYQKFSNHIFRVYDEYPVCRKIKRTEDIPYMRFESGMCCFYNFADDLTFKIVVSTKYSITFWVEAPTGKLYFNVAAWAECMKRSCLKCRHPDSVQNVRVHSTGFFQYTAIVVSLFKKFHLPVYKSYLPVKCFGWLLYHQE